MTEKDKETGIALHMSTKDALEGLKLVPMESYEHIILRLIEDYRKHHAPRKQEDDPPEGQTVLTKQEA